MQVTNFQRDTVYRVSHIATLSIAPTALIGLIIELVFFLSENSWSNLFARYLYHAKKT